MQEFSRNCRCCLKSTASDYYNDFVEFNKHVNGTQKIVDLFESLTSIKVDFADLENSKICGDCLEKLKSSYGFREMCLTSNRQIQDAIIKRESPTVSEFPEFVPVKLELKSEITEESYMMLEDDFKVDSQNHKIPKRELEADSRSKRAKAEKQKKPKSEKKLESRSKDKAKKDKNSKIKKEKTKRKQDSEQIKEAKPSRKRKVQTANENSYTCSYCARMFDSKILCNRHEKRVMIFTEAVFIKDVEWEEVHIRKIKFICDHCDKKYMMRSHMVLHLKTHFNIKNFKCELCSKGFVTNQQKEAHKKYFHKLAEKNIPCPHCDLKFFNQHILKTHLNVHKDERPFKCNFEGCGKTFRGKNTLYEHGKSHLSKTLDCEICGMKFKHPSTHRVHMKQHEFDASNITFSCDICSKSFKRKNVLKSHKRTEHVDFKQFVECSYCDMSFVTRSRLSYHIYGKHISNTFQCELCPQIFKLKKGYQRVYLTHVEEHHKNLNSEELENLQRKIKSLKFEDLATDFPNILPPPEISKQCENCHLRFSNAQQLEKHLELKCTKI